MCSIKVVSFFFFLFLLLGSKNIKMKEQIKKLNRTIEQLPLQKQKMCFNQVLLLLLLLLFSPSSSSSSPLDPRTSNLRISQKLCKVLKQVLQATGNSI
jgi:hypothetical protein